MLATPLVGESGRGGDRLLLSSLTSPRSNFAQLLKVMTIMIVCPSRQAACWGGVKAGNVSHSYTAAEKAPSLSALAAYFI